MNALGKEKVTEAVSRKFDYLEGWTGSEQGLSRSP
jgi:hypothetical protein